MGAWGTGNFANDDAMDWTYDLEESAGPDLLRETLETALANVAETRVMDVVMGLAAAEVVAAWHGQAGDDLPDGVREWLASQGAADGTLIPLARRLVDEAEERSQLPALWMDGGTGAEWHGVMAGLRERLERAVAS